MRRDMAKVIVERPRYGSSMPSRKKGYRRSHQRQTIDDLPKCESMLGRWRGLQRHLNEHLGPMHRFLRSCVGRPWNKIHQDLCEHVSFDNAVQKHVLAHVFDFVNKYVTLRGREVIESPRWGYPRTLQAGEMYVCPTTGILKVVRKERRDRPPHRVQAGPLTQYHWRDNAWWIVRLRKFPDDPGDLWDIWLERDVAKLDIRDCEDTYGGKLIAVSKRPLRPVEVKQLRCLLRTQRPQKKAR